MTRRTVLVAVAVLGAALAACSREGPPASHIVIGQPASAVSLDPYLHDEESTYSTLSHFYSRLVSFGPELEVQPDLALSWENPSDTVWRFRLRPGVRFHDGRPFEAEDAARSLRRAIEMPGSKVRFYLQAVESAHAVDPATLEVRTRYPTAVLLNKLALIDVVPRDTGTAPVVRPVGTGPYRFVAGGPGKPVVGERFAGFWGGAPAFDRVTVVPIPDERERVTAVSRRKADIAGRLSDEFWAWGQTQPGVRMVAREGMGVAMVGFSFREGSPFRDRRLRQAVARAVDRPALASTRGGRPLAVPMAQLVPPGVFGHTRGAGAEPPAPAKALELVRQAGYPDGLSARLLVADSSREVGGNLATQLAAAGLRLELESLPWPDFYRRWSDGRYAMAVFGWTPTTGDVSDVLDAVLHTPGERFGGSNASGYSNPELDRLIERSDGTFDPYQRLALLDAALRIVRDDVPVVPLTVRSHIYAVRPDLDWTPRRDRRIRAFDVQLRRAS